MFVGNVDEQEATLVVAPGAQNVLKQVLIGPREGWEGWVLRRFTLRDGGCTPRHRHPWPHVVYVLNGEGTVFLEGREHRIGPGFFAYIHGNAEHQFSSTPGRDVIFLCIVPEAGNV